MKIKVKDIPTSGVEFGQTINASLLDVDKDYWMLARDVDVDIYGERIADYVSLKIKLSSRKRIVCCRCLEEVEMPYELSFDWQDKIKDELQEIDVDELVRQEILLNIGVRELCSEDCQGICPDCGGNRNKGECNCSKD